MNVKPVYDLKTISSKTEPVKWEGMETIVELISDGFIVVWQHHGVFTGQIERENRNIRWLNDENPVACDEHIVRLRAFNEMKEYHFWRSGREIIGRLRTDEDTGSDTEVIETQMVLRGVVAEPLKQIAELAEGTVAVLTRNYIDHDPQTQQAGYVDSRFVNFESFNG